VRDEGSSQPLNRKREIKAEKPKNEVFRACEGRI